jgi:Haem-binding domain/Cytochrome P460
MGPVKLLATAAIVGFVAIQFIRPAITHPPVTAELQVPDPVRQILRTSCYDCHSNETRLPWFDQIEPAYWLVAADVKEARTHLNFSEIGKLPPAAQRALLYEAVNQIRLGAMPMPRYQRLHPKAAVSSAQLAILEQYLQPFAPQTAAAPAIPAPAAATPQTPQAVADEPNGFAFLPDYKNWKPISSTDRGDNHSLRLILGNDVAVKAIAERKIQPWPDGAAFAKVAWAAEPDERGILHAGKFVQVELMVKDKTRYAATAGWGWGRWRDTDLQPYGKGAKFDGECVNCHRPVRDNDFVYTLPIERTNERASEGSAQ